MNDAHVGASQVFSFFFYSLKEAKIKMKTKMKAAEEGDDNSTKRPREDSGELGLANSFVQAQEIFIANLEAKKQLLVDRIA